MSDFDPYWDRYDGYLVCLHGRLSGRFEGYFRCYTEEGGVETTYMKSMAYVFNDLDHVRMNFVDIARKSGDAFDIRPEKLEKITKYRVRVSTPSRDGFQVDWLRIGIEKRKKKKSRSLYILVYNMDEATLFDTEEEAKRQQEIFHEDNMKPENGGRYPFKENRRYHIEEVYFKPNMENNDVHRYKRQ